MKVTQQQIAIFFGLTRKTITNYKKDLKNKIKEGYIPPLGKHNLYKSMLLYFKLFNYKEEEHNNLYEVLKSEIDYLNDAFPLISKNTATEDIKKQYKQNLLNLKNIIDGMEK